MWTYQQTDGELLQNGEFVGTGYSGTQEGRNNPAMEFIPNIGPIPRGQYTIGPAHDELGTLGPCVMNVDANPGTNTFGRSAFRIHGNNAANDASHGCIILGPTIRHQIAASDDRSLEVIL